MTRLYANNYSSNLSAAITSNTQTSITVTSATGLPTLTGSDYIVLTLDDGTNVEIIKVTAISGTTLTIVRGQEGTTAQSSFASGTKIECRDTAASYSDAGITVTDVTTNNVSITAHGFAPKAPNDATKYLDGTGNYSTPAGGSGITSVHDDTAPKLGGDLNIWNQKVYSAYWSGHNTQFSFADGNFLINTGWDGTTNYHVQLKTITGQPPIQIQLYSDNASIYCTGFKSPSSLASSSIYTLPVAFPGVSGYILSCSTAGVLSWVSAPSLFIGASVYLGADQTLANNTATKLTINTKNFDTNTFFDATTNYRFQPTIAGYYQINLQVTFNSYTSNYGTWAKIYLNGTAVRTNNVTLLSGYITACITSGLIYLNGSTDYVEFYGLQATGTSSKVLSGKDLTFVDIGLL